MVQLLLKWPDVKISKPFVRKVAHRAFFRGTHAAGRQHDAEKRSSPSEAVKCEFDEGLEAKTLVKLLAKLPRSRRKIPAVNGEQRRARLTRWPPTA